MFLYPFIHTFEFVVTHFNYSLRPMNFSLAPFSASNSLWFESYNLLKIGTFMPFSVRSSGIIRHFESRECYMSYHVSIIDFVFVTTNR